MKEFFKGWRRKVGVVTLGIACLSMAMCIRSFVIPERIDFLCDGDNSNRIISLNGNLDWERFHQEGAKRLSEVQFTTARLIVERDERRVLVWKWNLLGCGKGEYQSDLLDELHSSNPLLPFASMTHFVWRIPYWLIVIPVTLLSAWLFLSKPKPKGT